MPDAATIRQQVEARIAELDALIAPLQAEYDQLHSVSATIRVAGAHTAAARPGATRRGARRPGKARGAGAAARAPKRATGEANRARQAVELIKGQPGITAAELAQAIGTSRNYLYRVLPKLEQSGAITKKGTGYEVAGDA